MFSHLYSSVSLVKHPLQEQFRFGAVECANIFFILQVTKVSINLISASKFLNKSFLKYLLDSFSTITYVCLSDMTFKAEAVTSDVSFFSPVGISPGKGPDLLPMRLQIHNWVLSLEWIFPPRKTLPILFYYYLSPYVLIRCDMPLFIYCKISKE